MVDAEAAWLEAVELIATREGWGSTTLLGEMQKIFARHRVSETQVERVLRLYGGRIAVVMETPEAPASDVGGTSPLDVAPVPGHSKTLGGHDGSRHAAAAVG